ncbi:hypothetical protein [Streptomyces sp. NPDC058683]|uniref:hypothetical protein n=1 Tax=Streptomyces sp. NPDC058683 TaxID=3346597 RepID=UPI00364D8588
MTDTDLAATLLAAYDARMRAVQPVPAPGITYEHDGPVLRVMGRHRGFVTRLAVNRTGGGPVTSRTVLKAGERHQPVTSARPGLAIPGGRARRPGRRRA